MRGQSAGGRWVRNSCDCSKIEGESYAFVKLVSVPSLPPPAHPVFYCWSFKDTATVNYD